MRCFSFHHPPHFPKTYRTVSVPGVSELVAALDSIIFVCYSKSYYYQSPLPTPKNFWSYKGYIFLINHKNYLKHLASGKKKKDTSFTFMVASSFSLDNCFSKPWPGKLFAAHYKHCTMNSLPWSSSHSVLYSDLEMLQPCFFNLDKKRFC